MRQFATALVLPMLLAGCALDEATVEEEGVGESSMATVASNALSGNALSGNALSGNALSGNALSGNSLSASALSSIQDPGEDGDLARMLLKYVVSCAFTDAQSLSFTWTDANETVHDETYLGELGLAPDWEMRPPTKEEQRWVSACLAARTNYYGVKVIISLRGTHAMLNSDEPERASYPVQEGAFWGNLFSSTPWLEACVIPANVDYARSKLRDCAAGHWDGVSTSECGIINRLGDCSNLCLDRFIPSNVPDDGYQSCGLIPEVITTYLE